jgi:L,D-transpeptidase YcbB
MKQTAILYLLSLVLLFPLFSQDNLIGDNIKELIKAGKESKSISVNGEILFSQNVLPAFYERNSYSMVWNNDELIHDLIYNLKDATNEGLLPTDYHVGKIEKLIKDSKTNVDPGFIAGLDLLLTDAALLYASHLIVGKVDQSKIRVGWDVPSNKLPDNSVEILEYAVENNKLSRVYDSIKPDHFMYVHLRNGLKKYRKIADNGGWPLVPTGIVYKKDILDSRVLELRKYLKVTGDLSQDLISDNDSIYDEEVENAVKKFQYRHNLNQDGIAGKGTLEVINVPVDKRIDEIRVNMERARWVIHHIPEDFLVVNIAGFNVRRIHDDSTVFYSRVIVGKHYHESPIFDGKLTYIELNPTWTLPYSIATKETLPKIKKDPNYLQEKNMIILNREGTEIKPETIDFSSLSSGNFPYTLRQKAGPHNALGEVKFMFPNKYAVYLHDTPARSLFAREDRAFSHGCIRIDKKWELFLNLMGDEWTMEKINSIIKSGKTTRINLSTPIEIVLLYWTAGADEDDELYFNKDVYGRDEIVLELLNRPFSYAPQK